MADFRLVPRRASAADVIDNGFVISAVGFAASALIASIGRVIAAMSASGFIAGRDGSLVEHVSATGRRA